MQFPIYASDLEIILKLFAPKAYELHLLDPEDRLEVDVDFEVQRGEALPKVLVNLGGQMSYCRGLDPQAFDLIVDFGGCCQLPEGYEQTRFAHRNNPDGTMRWIWPHTLSTPTFLNFYNSSGWKAELGKRLLKKTFNTPLARLFRSGSWRLIHRKALPLADFAGVQEGENYSIFTGTVGPNRKAVIEINQNGITDRFAKIALGQQAEALLQNEARTLQALAPKSFDHLEVPAIGTSGPGSVCVSNIQPKQTQQQLQLTSTHVKGMLEYATANLSCQPLRWTRADEVIRTNTALLRQDQTFPQSAELHRLLSEIHQSIDPDTQILMGRSHTDFTPWNCYVSDQKLHLYDWELSRTKMPLLFDLFHFVFQTGVLVERKSYAQIQQDLNAALSLPEIQQLMQVRNIDPDLYLKLYLLINVSYYLNVYTQQEQLHPQAYWLVEMWQEALLNCCPETSISPRSTFIDGFIAQLQPKQWSLLKFTEESLENLKPESDLDILITEAQLPALTRYCQNHPLSQKCRVYTKSFMTTVEVFLPQNEFLQIDLIHEFQRKDLRFLNATEVLQSSSPNQHQLQRPAAQYDFAYTFLFHLLNGASIPARYQAYFNGLSAEEQATIISHINTSFGLHANRLAELCTHTPALYKQVRKALQKQAVNRGTKRISNALNYLSDCWSALRQRQGFLVTFSGVDGAGKSTVIEHTKASLTKRFRKQVVVLRHRPSLLPILSSLIHGKKAAEARAASTLPRTGNNASLMGSALRFSYYYADYLFGQLYVWARYLLRGHIVLYDRYYFDFINDARRTNIALPKKWVKPLYALVWKPRINFFLYADPAVIRARKQELPEEDIRSLTHDYQTLFEQYCRQYTQSHFITIENIHLDETMQTILDTYSEAA